MAEPRIPIPVKLFVGMISSKLPLFKHCADILEIEFGPTDMRSPIVPWDQTDYYHAEMGDGLSRMFIFFKNLIDPSRLAEIKTMANRIEKDLADPVTCQRIINLDPGYITEAKIVLASAKDFAHRVYIGQQIYAEVTLQFREKGKSFIALDHTYPDFRGKDSIELFNKARATLRCELKRSPTAR